MPSDAPAIADVIEAVIKAALAPFAARLKALESRPPIDLGEVRERLATLETKEPLAGPPGPPGDKGSDGLGFDAYSVEYDGERTFTHKWTGGTASIEVPFRMPVAIYRGVFLDGKIYERGDMVTVSGSIYHADCDTTSRPGNGSKDWTLAVKRGKDDRGGPWPR